MPDTEKTTDNKPATLTRQMGLSPAKRKTVPVDVSEWNNGTPTTAYVRELLTCEREEYENLIDKAQADAKVAGRVVEATRAILACMVLCDADGNLIFRPSDAATLMNQPIKVLFRIYKTSMKLDGFYELGDADENP